MPALTKGMHLHQRGLPCRVVTRTKRMLYSLVHCPLLQISCISHASPQRAQSVSVPSVAEQVVAAMVVVGSTVVAGVSVVIGAGVVVTGASVVVAGASVVVAAGASVMCARDSCDNGVCKQGRGLQLLSCQQIAISQSNLTMYSGNCQHDHAEPLLHITTCLW